MHLLHCCYKIWRPSLGRWEKMQPRSSWWSGIFTLTCARTTMLHALTLTKHGKLPVVAALSPSAAPRSRWPPCVYVRFAGAWQTTCIWQRDPKDWAPLPPVWSRPPLPSVAAAGIQDIFSFGFRRAFLCLSEFSSDSEGSTVSRDLLLLTDVRGRRCLLLFPSRRLRLGDFAATR